MEVDAFDAGFARVAAAHTAHGVYAGQHRQESTETIHLVNDDEVWRWQDDSTAQVCNREGCGCEFWLLNRKHHCRPCGRIFCKECSDVDEDGVRWCKECRAVRETQDEALTTLSSRACRAKKMRNLVAKAKMDRPTRTDRVPLAALTSDGPPTKIFRIQDWLAADDGLPPVACKMCIARDDRVGDVVRIKVVPHGGPTRSRSGSLSPQAQQDQPRQRASPDQPSPTAGAFLDHHNAEFANLSHGAAPLSSFEEALTHSLMMCEKVVTYCDEAGGGDGTPVDNLPVRRVYDIFARPKGFLKPSVLWVVSQHLAGSRRLSDVLAKKYPPLVRKAPRKGRAATQVHQHNPYSCWGADPTPAASPILQEEEALDMEAIEMNDHSAPEYPNVYERVECLHDALPGHAARRDDAKRMSRGVGDEEAVAAVTQQLLKAVATVHAAGVVHRSLTPGCVLVTGAVGNEMPHQPRAARRGSEPRVVPPPEGLKVHIEDFASAMRYSTSDDAAYDSASPYSPFPDTAGRASVSDDRVVGAIGYLAPEAWDCTYTPQTDVWNIGCLVAELATGHSPFAWLATCLRNVVADVARASPRGVPAGGSPREASLEPAAPVQPEASVEALLADMEPAQVAEVCRRMKHVHAAAKVQLEPKPWVAVDAAKDYWSENFVHFLDLCFRPVEQRPSCRELLQHPFITRQSPCGGLHQRTHIDVQDAYGLMGTRLHAPALRVR